MATISGVVAIDGLECGELNAGWSTIGSFRDQTNYGVAGVSIVTTPLPAGRAYALKIDAAAATGANGYGMVFPLSAGLRGATTFVTRFRMQIADPFVINTAANIVMSEIRWLGTMRRCIQWTADATAVGGLNNQPVIMRVNDGTTIVSATTLLTSGVYYDMLWIHYSGAPVGPAEDYLYYYNTGSAAWVELLGGTTVATTGLIRWNPLAGAGEGIQYGIGSSNKAHPGAASATYYTDIAVQELSKSADPTKIIGAVTTKYLAANAVGVHNDFPGTAAGADVDEIPPDNVTTTDSTVTTGNVQAYGTVSCTAGSDTAPGILCVAPCTRINAHENAAIPSGLVTILTGIAAASGTDAYGANDNINNEGSSGTTKWLNPRAFASCEGYIDPDLLAWTEALLNGSEVLLQLVSSSGAGATLMVTQAGLAYAVERIAGPTYPTSLYRPPRRLGLAIDQAVNRLATF